MSDLTLSDILQQALPSSLRRPGLLDEAYSVIDDMSALFSQMVQHSSFCTNRDAVDVLQDFSTKWPRAKIISRNDVLNGFWTSSRMHQYLEHLSTPNIRSRLKQKRVMVISASVMSESANKHIHAPMTVMTEPEKALFEQLKGLHERGTFYSCAPTALGLATTISQFIFGMTLFVDADTDKPAVCVVPIPPAASVRVALTNLGPTLHRHRDYDPKLGPMRAFVTCDQEFMSTINEEFEILLRNNSALESIV